MSGCLQSSNEEVNKTDEVPVPHSVRLSLELSLALSRSVLYYVVGGGESTPLG